MNDESSPFYLTTGRVLEQWHTGTLTGHIEELARASGNMVLEINEQDAWTLKIAAGDVVEVKSRYGSICILNSVPPFNHKNYEGYQAMKGVSKQFFTVICNLTMLSFLWGMSS